MTILSLAWLLPIVIHVAYVAGTCQHFFGIVGTPGIHLVTVENFLIQWGATVGGANIVLLFLYIKMDQFKDHMFHVPNRRYWLSTTHTRCHLISKIRAFQEISLFCLNLFFLGIYQYIYQTNVTAASVVMPDLLLMVVFMGLPLASIGASMILLLHHLKNDPPTQ